MTEAPDEVKARQGRGQEEDGRPPWIIVGIGMVMLLVLLGSNIWTAFENFDSERRQDKLADCFRRVIVTIDVRTGYTEDIRKVEAQLNDAPTGLVNDLTASDTDEERKDALDKYLKKVKDLRAQRDVIIEKQSKYQYPDLDQCEAT